MSWRTLRDAKLGLNARCGAFLLCVVLTGLTAPAVPSWADSTVPPSASATADSSVTSSSPTMAPPTATPSVAAAAASSPRVTAAITGWQMSVTFSLAPGSAPTSSSIAWAGTLSCSISGAIPWTLVLAPGQTSATVPVAVVAQGESCEYQPGPEPELPAGYYWSTWLISSGTSVPSVNAGHTATFSAYFLAIVPPTAVPTSATTYEGQAVTFHPSVTQGTAVIEYVAFDNGAETKVVPGEGTWTIILERLWVTATFTPIAGFTGPATTQLYTVRDARDLSASSTLDVLVKAPQSPQVGDGSATIGVGGQAVIHPTLVQGTGQLTGAVFDNGRGTKVVSGQGTWVIVLSNGSLTVTFTPVSGYLGTAVQRYVVTDTDGFNMSGTLTVVVRATLADTGPSVNVPVGLAAIIVTLMGVALVVRRPPARR